MNTFEYRGFDRNGQARKGLVEALNTKEARERLLRDGILAERVAVSGRRIAFSVSDRSLLYHELSSLLASGIPLVKALEILMESPEMGEGRILVAGVRDRIREGSTLADALAAVSGSVTPFETAIIRVAEKSATLEIMLGRLGTFLEEQAQLRDRVTAALVYPTVVLAIGVSVAVVMLCVLIPRVRDIIAENKLALPALTRFMMGLGGWVIRWGWLAVVAAAGLAVYVRRRLKNEADFRLAWDRRMFRIPLIGRGRVLLANVRFARTLGTLIHGGVSLIDGLVLAGRATGSEWVGRLAETEAESVRHGRSLSEALRTIPPLAGSLPGWIQVGEASGGLENLLERAADRYQRQWDRFLRISLAFLEPVLILLVGAFVLLVTLSVLLPIMSMTQAVGR